MQNNDILAIDYVLEVSGVETVFSHHWKVATYHGPEADVTIIGAHAAIFHEKIENELGSSTTLSCVKMVNLTSPAKALAFPDLDGSGVGDTHPAHNCLRIDMYGKSLQGDPMWRNAINISGILESLSTRGRLNNLGGFANLLTFLSGTHQTGVNGATLESMIRKSTDLVGGAEFFPVQFARICEQIEVLRSRKFELCV